LITRAQRPIVDARWLKLLPPLIAFSVGFVFYCLRTTRGFNAIPGDDGDAVLNMVILEHVHRWLTGAVTELWSPAFYYPMKGALAFSDNHFGTIAVYSAARFLGASRETTFIIWFWIAHLLNFAACFYVLRKLGLSVSAASIGAFIFTFSLPVLVKDNHAQLAYRFWVPLAFYALCRAFEHGNLLKAWPVVIAIAGQFFCSVNLGLLLGYACGFLLAVMTVHLLWKDRASLSKARLSRVEGIIACACMIGTLALLGWMMTYYVHYARLYGFSRGLGEILSMLPRPKSFLIADRSILTSFVGSWITTVPVRHEQNLFFGIGPIFLLMLGIVFLGGEVVRGFLGERHDLKPLPVCVAQISLACLLTILFVIKIGGASVYVLVAQMPGFNSLRAVSRVGVILAFPVAVLCAYAVHIAEERITQFQFHAVGRLAVFALALPLVAIESANFRIVALSTKQIQVNANRLALRLPSKLPDHSVLWFTEDSDPVTMSIAAMVVAQDLNRPTINGHSGNWPPRTIAPNSCLSALRQLEAWSIITEGMRPPVAAFQHQIVEAHDRVCPASAVEARGEAISASDLQGIDIRIVQIEVLSGRMSVTVEVVNRNSRLLRPYGPRGRNLKVGWRLVAPGQAVGGHEWAGRAEVSASIPAGQSQIISFEIIDQAIGHKPLRFEASLVEEGVRWLHDWGLRPAQAQVDPR
jgi:hypothetical protein